MPTLRKLRFQAGLRRLLIVSLLLAANLLAAEECRIVRERKPLAVIVPSTAPTLSLAAAVEDLRVCIERMTTARVEVRPQPEAGLGVLWLLTEADLASPHADSAGRPPSLPTSASATPAVAPAASTTGPPDTGALRPLNAEGFIIRADRGQAWLIGKTPLGLQHAIYWLLEQWGCRWLFPGEAGEVIPNVAELAVTPEMQTAQQPRFLMRYLWYDYGNLLTDPIRRDWQLWTRRNRLEYSLTGSVGHAYQRIVALNDSELFRQHPELFPLSRGRPVQKGQLATENPLLRQRAVDYAFRYFEANPNDQMISMSPNDGGGPWKTRGGKYTRFTDAAVALANYVARALRNNPQTADKKVGMYAYFNTAIPPSIRVEDNVVIFVATRFSPLPWRWLLKGWENKARMLGIRDYASILDWSMTRPTWGLEQLKGNVRFWDENRVVGASIESGNDWGGWGLYHYVMGRLLWNPKADVDALVDDFLKRGFGRAAGDMKRYFGQWKATYSSATRNLALLDVAAALKRAQTDEIRQRIELYALYLHHLRLLDLYQRGPTLPREKEGLLRDLITFDSRLTNTNMAHTLPLMQDYLRKWAALYGIGEKELESLKSGAPFTQAEIGRFLEEDLKAARSQPSRNQSR